MMTKSKHTKQATFPARLLDILSNQSNWGVINWDADGQSFTIFDVNRFESEILPLYFRHARFSSFVRQLNMYHFHKIRCPSTTECCFQNKEFTRDSPGNNKIQRKNTPRSQTKRSSISTVASDNVESKTLEEENIQGQESLDNRQLQNRQMENIEQNTEMVERLVDEVRRLDLVLECDVLSAVEGLLRDREYQGLDRKFLPLIMESLGIQPEKQMRRQFSFRTEELLAIDPQLPSLKLII